VFLVNSYYQDTDPRTLSRNIGVLIKLWSKTATGGS
jgi:hypothetical protein